MGDTHIGLAAASKPALRGSTPLSPSIFRYSPGARHVGLDIPPALNLRC